MAFAGADPATRLATASDQELVLAVRAGDDSAFVEIHDRFRCELARYAARLLGDRSADAEDVLQEVFQRAHQRLVEASKPPVVLRPWLYRVTHNRCVDELRRQHLVSPWPQLDERGADVLWGQLETRLALVEVFEDLAALPVRQRTALLRTTVEGRSHAELAIELRTTVQASKSLVSRAREELAGRRALRRDPAAGASTGPAQVSAPPSG